MNIKVTEERIHNLLIIYSFFLFIDVIKLNKIKSKLNTEVKSI